MKNTILSLLITATSTLGYFVYELNTQINNIEGRQQATVILLPMVQENIKNYVDETKTFLEEKMEYLCTEQKKL